MFKCILPEVTTSLVRLHAVYGGIRFRVRVSKRLITSQESTLKPVFFFIIHHIYITYIITNLY